MNIASGHFLLLAAALALACAPMPTALTDTLTTTESSETTDGVETGSTGAETSGATAVTTACTDTGEGSTAVTSDATTSEETETEETALTTDATTIEPTTDDPTTIGPTTDDPTDETSDGAGDLEIFVDLTSANILCNDAPESPFEASWVVSLDNSQGLAPVTVALESAYLSFTWTFERVSASYVTVAPDGSVGVGASSTTRRWRWTPSMSAAIRASTAVRGRRSPRRCSSPSWSTARRSRSTTPSRAFKTCRRSASDAARRAGGRRP